MDRSRALRHLLCGLILSLSNLSKMRTETEIDQVQHTDGIIQIGGLIMVHLKGEIRLDGIQTVEAINMAVDQINRDDSILPGIELGTTIVDTNMNDSYAFQQIVTEFLPLFYNTARATCTTSKSSELFAGVIGASTSGVSINSAKLLQAFSIPQISYWATNPTLSDKEIFPYFFRTIPSDTHLVKEIVEFAYQQKWTYISVVYVDSHYGSRAFSEFTKVAAEKGICIAVKYGMPVTAGPEEYRKIIDTLKTADQGARVVLLYVMKGPAKEIMKAAAADQEAAGRFLWIANEVWTRIIPEENDQIESYESELDGAIGFSPKTDIVPGFKEYFTSITLEKRQGSNRNPWFAEYISLKNGCSLKTNTRGRRKCEPGEHYSLVEYEQFPYLENVIKAVQILAHSINDVHKNMCGKRPGVCEDMKKWSGSNALAKATYEIMKNTTITTIDGEPFTFDENGDPPSRYYIYNYKKEINAPPGNERKKWIKVATIDHEGIEWVDALSKKVTRNGSYCSTECEKNEAKIIQTITCCWYCQKCEKRQYVANDSCVDCEDGEKPNLNFTGCDPITIEYMRYDKPHSITSVVLGIVGVVCTALVVALYVKERNCPVVKASGKELCFFVLTGILLTFLNFLGIVGPPTSAKCAISRLILAIGPTAMYAALLTKTLRVVIIFRSVILTPKVKIFLQPVSQLVFTALIVSVQAFAVVIWMVVSPPRPEIYYYKEDDEAAYKICSNLSETTILIGLVYPFVLIVICTVLSTMNRKVPTGFNETKLVGFTMYTTCVIWLAFVPIFVTNKENYDVKLMTVSFCLSLSAFTVLLCMLVPRCYTILCRPEKNTPQAMIGQTRSKLPLDSHGKSAVSHIPQSSTELNPSGSPQKNNFHTKRTRLTT